MNKNQKKLVRGLLVLALVCCITIVNRGILMASDEDTEPLLTDTPIEVTSDIAVYDKYMWRGFKLDDDPVIQPGIYLSGWGFEASVWSSFDFDADDDLNSDEVDYVVGYSHDLNEYLKVPLTVSGGFAYYDFPAADLASREFYVGAALDVILSPSVTWYHDFGEEDSGGGDGDYVVGELSYSYAIPETPASLDLSAHVGYNNELFIVGDGGGDVGLGAALTIALSEKCTIAPTVGYSIPFGDLEDANDGNQDDEVYFGGVLAYSF
ncbi:TorF family putative porin [Candidatus Omnitrophota bacterium]